ncbi:MAG: hypothetical protein ACFFHV_02820 [Promethearchaeota archaeon]
MTKLKGKFNKTTEGNETYDIEYAEAEHIFPVATLIQKEFSFEPVQLPIFGLDSVYLEMIKQDIRIIVGWDIWSGLFVMATHKKANSVVRKIGEFLYTQEIND